MIRSAWYQLQYEAERLRNIRESKMEIDWCNQALASLRQKQTSEIIQDQGDPLLIPQQGEHRSCKERSAWRVVHVHSRWQVKSFAHLTPQGPWHKVWVSVYRRAAKGERGWRSNHTRGSPQSERLTHLVTTTYKSKKRWAIVVGNSVLRRTEGIRWPGQTHREVYCLPGTGVKDITRKLRAWCCPQTTTHYCSAM